ncbi:MAG: PTS ascorbate transporter subunit IIC [Malacoplasma sp.]
MENFENTKLNENNLAPTKSVRKYFAWIKPWMVWLLILVGFIALFIGLAGNNNWDWGLAAEIAFKQVLVDNFLGITPILLGLLTFIGYLVLKRGFIQSFLGFIKTAIGVIILSIGSGIIVGMSKPIFANFGKLMGTNIISLDPYLGFTSAQSFLQGTSLSFGGFAVSAISFSMIVALGVNIILVLIKKVSNMRAIMVTGHIMFQQSSIMTAMTFMFIIFSMSTVDLSKSDVFYPIMIGTILISGITLGFYWATTCSAVAKQTNIITQNAGFTLGHQQMIGAFVASKLGRLFGKAEDSAEHRKLSRKFKLFEDNIFTQLLIVFVLFFTLIMVIQFAPLTTGQTEASVRFFHNGKILAGWDVGGTTAHWSINMILGPFKFIGGLLVLTMGVRMFVTELQQSFQGIVDKVIKDGIVAVDVAATYGFSPNSVTYGFLSGTIAQFIAMALTVGISFIPGANTPIVVPLFITLFFNSGAMGVYANSSGGWKASIIVPAIMGFSGILMVLGGTSLIESTFLQIKDMPGIAPGVTSPIATGYIGMFDWNFFYSIFFMIMSIPFVGVWLSFALMWTLFIVWAQFITYTDGTSGYLYKKFGYKFVDKWKSKFQNNTENIEDMIAKNKSDSETKIIDQMIEEETKNKKTKKDILV